jgi:phosphomannomutase
MKLNSDIFHAYDIRGVYPEEIAEETAYRLGTAFALYLQKDLKLKRTFSVVVGMDMRGSSPYLARQVIRGLNDQGIDVVEVGKVPTPAFYYAVAFRDFAAGIMITASHNPKEYNGFKFCRAKAAPIGFGSGLELVQKYFDLTEQPKPLIGSARGKFSSLEKMTDSYVSQELSYLNPARIKKLKIVADPANAMGAVYLEELFQRIACDPVKLNWDLNGNMPIHEANPLKTETLQQLQAVIKNETADFGIATDGDGDRIAFLDDQAQIIPSAIVLGLVAQQLLKKFPGAKIGFDLRSSRSAKEMIAAAGGTPVEHMNENDLLLAGEVSGHYYFRENYYYESPVFMIAMLLLIRSELNQPFSMIWRLHQKYFHSGEINFEVSDKEGTMKELTKKYQDGKLSRLDGIKVDYQDWWFSVRPSNTEPFLRLNLEADTEQKMKQKIEEISDLIKSTE